MPFIVAQYERAARNATGRRFSTASRSMPRTAYLLDQFIETGNQSARPTHMAAPVEKPGRDCCSRVAEALMPIWGPDRIGGAHLSDGQVERYRRR